MSHPAWLAWLTGKKMQTISIPHKPKFTKVDDISGKFEIEGCYPGYGTTLGNSLRRVLLSSMAGSAITSVKIKGVSHEFSTINNIQEDVIQIILNLKQIRFKSYKAEPVKVYLKVKGEKQVKAGMINCPSDVEIINKGLHLANITSPKGELEMEIEVESGIGYVPVEQQEKGEKEVGIIAIDAIYKPVRKVNYVVENMRVGKKTDYEKITLEITTDGSINPEEAFAKAVEILINQFSALKDLAEKEIEEKAEKADEKKPADDKKEKDDPKKTPITELRNLSTRTVNVLAKNKLETVGDVIKLTESQVTDLEGMGAKGIKEIKKAVGDFGFNLKQEK